jgi:hypothetical protein
MVDASGVWCRLCDAGSALSGSTSSSLAAHGRFRSFWLIWNDNFTSLSIWNIHSILKSRYREGGLPCFVSGAAAMAGYA